MIHVNGVMTTNFRRLQPLLVGIMERQALSPTPKDKVKAAYDRSERLQRQRDLFQEWADLLVDL